LLKDAPRRYTMSKPTTETPMLMPVLGRGKHRTPKSGACFMEYASLLAGERWSDHPACTHPAVAALARLVNDCSSDARRTELATLIPSVIGLAGDGRRTSINVAVRAMAAAIPVVSYGRQRALAAGALRLTSLVDSRDVVEQELLADALETVPDAAVWAEHFTVDLAPIDPRMIDRMCDAIIRTSVIGIAEACVPDPDDRLRSLLAETIADLSSSTVEAEARMPEPQPVA
jgi:hypothetical protein